MVIHEKDSGIGGGGNCWKPRGWLRKRSLKYLAREEKKHQDDF